MMRRIVIILTIIILIVGGAIGLHIISRKGDLEVVFNLPDSNQLQVTLNQKTLETTSNTSRYRLKPGEYSLHATKPGYRDFNTTFTISTDTPIIVNAHMIPISNISLTDNTPVTGLIPDIPNLHLLSVEYFYDDTWAFVRVQVPNTDAAVAVLSYDPIYKQWSTSLGPGTHFAKEDLVALPPMIKGQLEASGYTGD